MTDAVVAAYALGVFPALVLTYIACKLTLKGKD